MHSVFLSRPTAKRATRLGLAALILLAGAAGASADFGRFVHSLWPQAQARGVSRATFDAALRGVTPDSDVIERTRKQAEFVKPVGDYLETAVSAKRIEKGRAKAREWKETLEKVERAYGVDSYIVLGVWGMETNFGGYVGDKYVIRALATLAYARYRGDYFKKELLSALQILEAGHVQARDMQGSWAGAMGQTQFMPTSFNQYAVDFDGDGHKDIWTNVPDALASTANYLKKHGWIA
ncbi:MAG TPA: lytic murein transglycosylase, partial [Bradyrhizobium sp.]|nr:lytic murein transglycosylase [Bradyrhizobium sp.]